MSFVSEEKNCKCRKGKRGEGRVTHANLSVTIIENGSDEDNFENHRLYCSPTLFTGSISQADLCPIALTKMVRPQETV